jgi:quinol monooxygenase YgiN
MYGVIARFRCQPGEGQAVLEILREMAPVVAVEPGTTSYAIHASTNDPDEIWAYEMFTDRAAYDVHEAGLVHNDVRSRLDRLVDEVYSQHLDLAWSKAVPLSCTSQT